MGIREGHRNLHDIRKGIPTRLSVCLSQYPAPKPEGGEIRSLRCAFQQLVLVPQGMPQGFLSTASSIV